MITFAIVAMTACNNGDNEDINNGSESIGAPIELDLSPAEMKLTAEGQVFGIELFSAVNANETDKENIVISPLSLNIALAMVWNGANGETKSAIQKAMGMSNYPQEEVNAYFKKLSEALPKTDPTTKLALANSIWTRQDFPVKESFYDVNRQWYNAKISELDFNSPTAKDVINQWCSDNTNGLIKEMVKEIPVDIVMYLMNALYFKGEWSKGFAFPSNDTKDADFRKENGQTVKVKMMGQKSEQSYYSDDYLAHTSLPYGNGAYKMVFMLPNNDASFNGMIERLKQPEYLSNCLRAGMKREVNLFVPRFKIEFETELNKPLEQMGMGIAFTDFADFSGISEIQLCISKVKQKTFIEVNEEGTEAAAVTSAEMALASAEGSPLQPVTFRANRPFLFLIQENSSGAILFMGKIGNSEQ
ncbi:MAG: serpin family protein [Dysgonamonadaceae bacterium]|nr:serpin family protein [Dysgonamonadaceae bacterium]